MLVVFRYASVIATMRKSEDSLRRLKKGRQGFSLFGNRSVQEGQSQTSGEEEDRVKAQFLLDVDALARDAASLGVQVEAVPALESLRAAIVEDNK
jgi:hypothetical protein